MRRAVLRALALALAACQAGSGASGDFDGGRAFTYIERQLAFGPRIPNTPGHRQAGDWLEAELRARADTVVVQAFTQYTRRGDTLALRNFFARFRPEIAERVLYVAHWDTRPRADQSANLAAQRQPVPGANDGGSGVALLLGVADALRAQPPPLGVDLLFVDGEDYGDFSDSTESLIGSRHFAAHRPPGYQPLYAVVWDMVADADLVIYQEGYSASFAPEVVQRVWDTADRLGYGRHFPPSVLHTVTDDHVPLQRVGIRAVDVIDFDYGPNRAWWHTTDDTIDKVSARSLQIVGDVAVALIRR